VVKTIRCSEDDESDNEKRKAPKTDNGGNKNHFSFTDDGNKENNIPNVQTNTFSKISELKKQLFKLVRDDSKKVTKSFSVPLPLQSANTIESANASSDEDNKPVNV
jgi:hypothetical protein